KWIGLAHVKPKPGNDTLSGALEAYVAAIALAKDSTQFSEKVTTLLNEYGFDVLRIEDIELLKRRIQKFQVAADLTKLAEDLTPENPVALGTLHSYKASS